MTQNRLQLTGLFDRFARAAQHQIGATHLENDVCRSTVIQPPAGRSMSDYTTTGCGGESKFALPTDGGDEFRKPDPAVVCVVDDMAYEFPKYGG